MTARILPFPNFFRPATPRDEMGVILILESRSESNQRQTRNGWGATSRKTIYHRNGLRVGAADAVQSATSETMDVTGGESAALIFPRECPKIAELRRQSRRLREHFNPRFTNAEG